jgi:hypothetical protein
MDPETLLLELVDQIARGDYTDGKGHDLKRNRAFVDALEFLGSRLTPPASPM